MSEATTNDKSWLKAHLIARELDDGQRAEMLCGRIGQGGQSVTHTRRPLCDGCRKAAHFVLDHP